MQTMARGMDSLSVLMQLNWDRILYVAAIAAALFGGAALGTVLS